MLNYHNGLQHTPRCDIIARPHPTLDSVTIQLSGAWLASYSVTNNVNASGDATVNSIDVQMNMLVDIFNDYNGNTFGGGLLLIEVSGFAISSGLAPSTYDPDLAQSAAPPGATLPDTVVPGQTINYGSFGDSWTATLSYTGGDLAQFIGSDKFVIGCAANSVDSSSITGGDAQRGGATNAECVATVTYDYTGPPPAPAPAPLALMGIGVFGVIAAARRRRASREATR